MPGTSAGSWRRRLATASSSYERRPRLCYGLRCLTPWFPGRSSLRDQAFQLRAGLQQPGLEIHQPGVEGVRLGDRAGGTKDVVELGLELEHVGQVLGAWKTELRVLTRWHVDVAD